MSGFRSTVLSLRTGRDESVTDVTWRCQDFVAQCGVGEGLLNVFVPHATAGVAVMETGAGSDDDLLAALRELLPADGRWRHEHGSFGHGRDHVVPSLVAPYATLPVVDGRIALGTWQSIVVVDTNRDNPERSLRLSMLS